MKLNKTQHEYDTEELLVGENIVIGQPLAFSSGELVANATAPEYVSLASAKDGEMCLVHKIRKDEDYAAVLNADGSSLVVGDAVTIATNGKVTATKTSGIFRITQFGDSKASGEVVIGRFI